MRVPAHIVLLSAVLGATACGFDGDVPVLGGQLPQIACSEDEECPEGWICQPTLDRCIPLDLLDRAAPALVGDPALTPEVGGAGQTFTLDFTVSEALFQPPVVQLEIGGGERADFAMDVSASAPDALSYVFTYTTSGNEPEGNRAVTIDLIDLSGNEVNDLSAGSLVLDFTRPWITSAELSHTHASQTTVHLSLELSEPILEAPQVELRSPGARPELLTWSHEGASGTLGHHYTFTPSGSEVEGTYAVLVSATDQAGNQLRDEDVDQLVLDFTPPDVVETKIVPAAAPAGQRVLVEVELSEPIADHGALSAEPTASSTSAHNYIEVGAASTLLRYEHTVVTGEDGSYQLVLHDLVDLAGNHTDSIDLGEVRYDSAPPALVDYSQSHQSLLAEDTLEVSFATSEPLDVDPVVTLGGVPLQRVGSDDDPYLFGLPMSGTSLVGVHVIQVRLIDEVGNEAVLQPGVVDVDAVPPLLVDLVFTPPAARLNITAVMTVTASEPLGASPTVTWLQPRGDPGFTYLGVSGLGHMYALEITPAIGTGVYEVLEISIEDVAGNSTTTPTSGLFAVFEVDNAPPVLSGLTTDAQIYSAQAGYEAIQITFDVDESLDDPGARLEVSLDGELFVCQPYQGWSPSYRCDFGIDGSQTEGTQIVTVRAVDAAGNESSASTSVRLDFTAPSLVATVTDLYLEPPAGSLVNEVSALGVGGTARVLFALDEPIAVGTLPLVHSIAPEVLVLAHESGNSAAFVYAITLPAGPRTNGDYALLVEVEDAVGNSADLPLGVSLPIDTTAPTPVLVDNLTYTRVPWGADSTGGLSSFTLESSTAATFEADATVIVWDQADLSLASELGRGVADALGALPAIALNRADRPSVYVVQVDDAGNSDSASATLVHNVTWVATLGGKVAGSFFANPLTYRANAAMSGTLAAEIGQEHGQEAGVTDVGGASSTVQAEGSWRQVGFAPQLGKGKDLSVAEDTVRGRVVAFGSNGINGTFEWDGFSWRKVLPADPEGDGNPPGREYDGMAFDPVLNLSIMVSSGTWGWDGYSWRQMPEDDIDGDGEPTTGKVAYDPDLDRMIAVDENYTWEWDRNSWRQLGPSPANNEYTESLIYDRANQELLALTSNGMNDSNPTMKRLVADSWQTFTPDDGVLPPGWSDFGLAFDRTRDRVVLFGGRLGMGGDLNETWEWDGAHWTEVVTTNTPVARSSVGLAWDPVTGLLLAAGGGEGLFHNDRYKPDSTWVLDGARWRQMTLDTMVTAGTPSDEMWPNTCYDTTQDRTIVYGGMQGETPFSWVGSDETWFSRGGTWHRISGGAPGGLCFGTLLCNPDTGAVLMQGGFGGDNCFEPHTSSWSLTNGVWSEEATGITTPLPEYADRVVYYPPLSTFVWYRSTAAGGADNLWRWDGVDWVEHAALGSPGSIGDPTLAYDAGRGLLVLWGGQNPARDGLADPLVVHEGQSDGTWSTVTVTDPESDGSPVGRKAFGMAYDRARGRVLIHGGCATHEGGFVCAQDQLLDDTWEWGGQSFRRAVFSDPEGDANPSAGEGMKILETADPLRMIGNRSLINSEGLIWDWDGGSRRFPAHRVEVPLLAATDAEVFVERVQLHALAAGQSPGQDGAVLKVWDRGGWDRKFDNDAASGAVAPLDWFNDDPFEVQRLFSGPARSLHFAITSRNPRGTGEAEVELDYFEIRIDYIDAP